MFPVRKAQSPEVGISVVYARKGFGARLERWAWNPVVGTSQSMRRTLEEVQPFHRV